MDITERNFEETIERTLPAVGPDAAPAADNIREPGLAYGEIGKAAG